MFDIFTDTSANLSDALCRDHALRVVPFHYIVDGTVYPRETEVPYLSGHEFYEAMRQGANVSTSMINTAAYYDAFEQSLSQGRDLLYVGMSSGISGSYGASVIAADMLREKYPEREIRTIDTRAASLGEGLVVLYAARLRDEGRDCQATAEECQALTDSIVQVFTVDDLAYLRRGGRVSGAKAVVGKLLNIKPVLRGDDEGKIVQYRCVRGHQAALDVLVQKYEELVMDKSLPVAIADADCAQDTEYLITRLRGLGFTGRLYTACYEPVTGSHVGPGTVALFFCGAHR
ncbi:MAG: DegV family protein [Oscillospiraceae bacterium]